MLAARVRGFAARKRARNERLAATLIQRHFRGIFARRRAARTQRRRDRALKLALRHAVAAERASEARLGLRIGGVRLAASGSGGGVASATRKEQALASGAVPELARLLAGATTTGRRAVPVTIADHTMSPGYVAKVAWGSPDPRDSIGGRPWTPIKEPSAAAEPLIIPTPVELPRPPSPSHSSPYLEDAYVRGGPRRSAQGAREQQRSETEHARANLQASPLSEQHTSRLARKAANSSPPTTPGPTQLPFPQQNSQAPPPQSRTLPEIASGRRRLMKAYGHDAVDNSLRVRAARASTRLTATDAAAVAALTADQAEKEIAAVATAAAPAAWAVRAAAIDELGVPYGLRATESCRTYKLRATPSTSASSVSEVRAAARAELEPVSDM